MLNVKNLNRHQWIAIKDIIERKILCITADCGFGKTVVSLATIVILKKKKLISKVLIVAPSKSVDETWAKEHLKWEFSKDLKIVKLTNKKHININVEADIYVTSFGNLGWIEKNNIHKFDFILVDEAHNIKGATSVRRENLIEISKHAKWKVLATATPMSKNEIDLFGLCHFMDGGKSLGTYDIETFRALYCYQIAKSKNNRFYTITKEKAKIVRQKVKHLFQNYEIENFEKVKIKTIDCYGNLSKESLEKYNKLYKEQCINGLLLDKNVEYDEDEKALEPAQLNAKLNELASGFLYFDKYSKVSIDTLSSMQSITDIVDNNIEKKAIQIFDDRIQALNKLLLKIRNEHGDTPVIVCHHFKQERVNLINLLPNALTDQDENFVDLWNSGKYPYLILQYRRSSTSLNLQRGGNIMVFYSSTYAWIDDYQIIRRIARKGQQAEMVYAYRLYLKNTIDENKIKTLGDKTFNHKTFQNKIIRKLKDDNNSV